MSGIMTFVGEARAEDYAGAGLACAYADGVLSLAWSPHNAKFYLYRNDSPPLAKPGAASVPIAQIVMPIDGFCATTAFFVQRLGSLKGHDTLRRETLTAVRDLCEKLLRE